MKMTTFLSSLACLFLTAANAQDASPLFFSEYAEGSSNNKYLEIYNPTSEAVDLAGYAYPSVSNAPTTVGVHESWNTFDEGAVIAPGDVYVIAHGSSDPVILAEANETHNTLSNGDDGYALVFGTEDDHIILDVVGDFNGDPGSGWPVAGVSNATKDHTLVRKFSVTSGNTDWSASAGTNEEDSEWIVFDNEEWSHLGSHTSLEEAVLGCTDSTAFNFNELATELDDSCVPVVSGCTDQAAFNYNDAANVSDADSCVPVVSGCIDSAAVNFDASANTDDGSCNKAVINFTVDMNGVEQPSAGYDNVVVNGSWNGWQGWGVTLADADADGVYTGSLFIDPNATFEYVVAVTGSADGYSGWGIQWGDGCANANVFATSGEISSVTASSLTPGCAEILGCMDANASNYDSTATQQSVDTYGNLLCLYASCDDIPEYGCIYADSYSPFTADFGADACSQWGTPCEEPTAAPLFFSEYAEGSSNNKYLEIFNPTADTVDLAGYAYPSVGNDPTTPGEHEYWNAFDEGASIAPGDVYVIAHGSSDSVILAEADETHNYLSNGDDGYALAFGTESSYVVIDWLGNFDADPGNGWAVAGIADATKDHTLVRKFSVTSGNSDWTASAGTSSEDSEWTVLDKDDWTNLGSHTDIVFVEGCTDMSANNYNADATVNDGSCTYDVTGCMDSTAFNYNPEANIDDNSCEYTITGCTDSTATNYNAEAVTDDGSCQFPIVLGDVSPLFFSEYAEGTSNNKYLEIYNPTDSVVSLAGYAYPSVANDPTTPGEHEYWNAFDEGASIAPGDVYVIAHGSADATILAEADETHNFLSNGDDGYALAFGTESSYVVIDWLGNFDADPGSGWAVAGVADATKDHTLVRKLSVTQGNSDWTASAGTSAEDSEWIVLEQNDWTNLGSHTEQVSDNPTSQLLSLPEGWSIFSTYMIPSDLDMSSVLAPIFEFVAIAKDFEGSAYLPEYNFNGIGDMFPGQGYQLKLNEADVLTYLSNEESYRFASLEVTSNVLSHFAAVSPTDQNMTIVIEDAAWAKLPNTGAEIAVYDQVGSLVGSAVYSSPVTVLTVWGDDATTRVKDGLFDSEELSFYVWDASKTSPLKVASWLEGDASFVVNAVNVVSSISFDSSVVESRPIKRELIKVINVLGREVNPNHTYFEGTVLFKIYNDGTVDKLIK